MAAGRLVAVATSVAVAFGAATLPARAASPDLPSPDLPAADTASSVPHWGVYTAPGPSDVEGAAAFASFGNAPVSRVLDFLPTSSWLEMTRNAWLLSPYQGSGYKLMLSVPMLPDTAGVSLADCAAGAYDDDWRSIAGSLVSGGLTTTEIRPGWEFNGNWYKWSAAGKVSAYIGCFQDMVTVMRSVSGTHFTFSWNPNLGGGTFPAEQAWPGAGYVDDVAIDVYDTSWSWYPTPPGVTLAQAQTNSWNWIKKGDHGLNFWAAFAAQHSRPLAIAEWGLTWRSDGHGGGDDPGFVDGMFDFMLDPANHVTYADYFDSVGSSSLDHQLVGGTRFPASAARVRARLSATAPAGYTAPTPTGSTGSGTGKSTPTRPSATPAPAPPAKATPAKPVAIKPGATKPGATKPSPAKTASAKNAKAKKAKTAKLKAAKAKKAKAAKLKAKRAKAAKHKAAKHRAAKHKPTKPTKSRKPGKSRPRASGKARR